MALLLPSLGHGLHLASEETRHLLAQREVLGGHVDAVGAAEVGEVHSLRATPSAPMGACSRAPALPDLPDRGRGRYFSVLGRHERRPNTMHGLLLHSKGSNRRPVSFASRSRTSSWDPADALHVIS